MSNAMVTLAVLAFLATGCGDGAQEVGSATEEARSTDDVGDGSNADVEDGDVRPTETGGMSATTTDEAPGGSVQTVQAGEAGEVDVRIGEGGQLELVEVRAADGWRHTVNKTDRDEIELDFHDDAGGVFRLEVELEDGRFKVNSD